MLECLSQKRCTARQLSGGRFAFTVVLEQLELVLKRLATRAFHEPAKEKEHDFGESSTVHIRRLCYPRSTLTEVFECIANIEVKDGADQLDRAGMGRVPFRHEAFKLHSLASVRRDYPKRRPQMVRSFVDNFVFDHDTAPMNRVIVGHFKNVIDRTIDIDSALSHFCL